MAYPRVFEPIYDWANNIICDNCQLEEIDHCGEADCKVCPGEVHICILDEGKFMRDV